MALTYNETTALNLDLPGGYSKTDREFWHWLVKELVKDGRIEDTWAWSRLIWIVTNKEW